MRYVHRLGPLALACALFTAPVGGEQPPIRLPAAKTASGTYQNPARGFRLPIPALSGPVQTFEYYEAENPTATVFFLDSNEWMVGAIYTRIRADYPQDFRLIESRIKPRQENSQRLWGAQIYLLSTEDVSGTPVLMTTSLKPAFNGERDFEYLPHTGGDFDPDNRCQCVRSDFHFVRNGYYVHLLAVVNTKTGLSSEAARVRARTELVRALEQLQIGSSAVK